MATSTAEIARAVVNPAISIIRRTRKNSAACSGFGHAKLKSTRLVSTRFVARSRREASGHGRRRRRLRRARSRAGGERTEPVALAAERADPGGFRLGWNHFDP